MVALWNRADHYIFMLWFVLSSFFPRLISAAADWKSAILPHIWCGLSANLRCRSKTCCARLAANTGRKNSPKIAIWLSYTNFPYRLFVCINPLPSDRLRCCDRYRPIRCHRLLAVKPLSPREHMRGGGCERAELLAAYTERQPLEPTDCRCRSWVDILFSKSNNYNNTWPTRIGLYHIGLCRTIQYMSWMRWAISNKALKDV